MDKRFNPLDNKFKNDQLKFEVIKNIHLVCRDCKFRFDDTAMPCNTSKCAVYSMKPFEVLDGGNCIEYEKEV